MIIVVDTSLHSKNKRSRNKLKEELYPTNANKYTNK